MSINNNANTFNGAKPPKLPFQIALVSVIAETGNNESLEGISTDVGVLVWFELFGPLGNQVYSILLGLSLFPIAHLQPALGGFILIRLLVLLKFRQESSNAADGSCPALLRRMVRGFYPS